MELFDVHAVRVAREVNLGFVRQRKHLIAISIVGIILVRAIVGAATPLSFDEAYYWLWSKHLAAGYLDHPPLIAFVIRAGTAIFGATSFGVRAVPWLLSAAASWAVWRAAAILLQDEKGGAIAALLFNLMPMIAVESLVATPDAPEIAAAAFLLLALAEIADTGYGPWWIAAGIAAGIALVAKYTAFFLGAGILVWLVAMPEQRRWLGSFWPYFGAAIALLMFAPVVLWNAAHGWISFAMQFGRADAGTFTLRYFGEFLAAQFGLATPFIAVLGVMGIVLILRTRVKRPSHLALLLCMLGPGCIYFLVHSLHDRVQGNWPSFLYPALAVTAAAAYGSVSQAGSPWTLRLSRRLSVPVAAAMVAVIYAQALWGVIPRVRDPVSRLLAFGMGRVVADIESLRVREHANAVLTTNYALTGWLAFYMPTHPPIIQLNERFRYLNEPPPPRNLFQGPLLYVSDARNDKAALVSSRFLHVLPLAHIARYRNGATIDEYAVYRVEGLKREPFDQGK